MRVLHIIDDFKLGGAQTHLVTMLREFGRRGFGEHVVIGLFESSGIDDDLRGMRLPVSNLSLRADLGNRSFGRVMNAVRNAIRINRPDVVEAHLTWSRLFALPMASIEGVPRRLGFEQGDIYLSSWKFRLANFLDQWFAHQIVCCSHGLASWVARTHFIQRARLVVLHNCVDLDLFKPRWENDVHKRILDSACVFCSVGTLGRGVNKRVDISIQALALARDAGADVGLVVCGDGDQRQELERLTHTIGIADYVRFLGMRRDVREVMASCDAFCHAAPFEPFGIVCIEAMAVGLPVIVPAAGGIQETVREGSTGALYAPLDAGELAAAMVKLHDDPCLRESMGREARRDAEDRFSVKRYVDSLIELYAGGAN